MSEPAARRATYDERLNLPDDVVGEILDGTLHAQPRPAPRHASAASRLGATVSVEFDDAFDRRGGWRILDEPELHLGDDVIVSDISGWRRPRLAELPDIAWIETVPDWACEVPSPSTAGRDRVVKQAIYAREGVSHLWFVDPNARTVEVFALGDDRHWSLVRAVEGDDAVALQPFDALEFPLARLWS